MLVKVAVKLLVDVIVIVYPLKPNVEVDEVKKLLFVSLIDVKIVELTIISFGRLIVMVSPIAI
jgi:hypothetical protein